MRCSIGAKALLAIFPVVAADAQSIYFGLTTTNDGTQLWFSSSLQLRTGPQYPYSKIYRVDGNGVTVQAHRDLDSTPLAFYSLDQPQVTGDGKFLIYSTSYSCGPCRGAASESATLVNLMTGQETSVGTNARISRNGKYLATYSSTNAGPFVIKDLAQSVTLFQGTDWPRGVSVASDGTTAFASSSSLPSGALQLIKGGVLSKLGPSNVTATAIDDSASTLVYETSAPRRLFVMDLRTMTTHQLGPDDRDSFQATISADGQKIAYLSTLGSATQLFISRTDGTDWKQLSVRGDGIAEATLSGDAKTAFATTGDRSILQIDSLTGAVTTLVGPTPRASFMQRTTPGSFTTLQGAGLANVSLLIDGVAPFIFQKSDTSILLQIPWEASAASLIKIPEAGAPYFDVSIPMDLGHFFPAAIPLGPLNPKTGTQPIAIHSDFRSIVTDDNPALPGEIVHIYLTGGGEVTPPVATGAITPAIPLSNITTPITVIATGSGQAIDLYFFGLAPGLIGVWQMDAALPKGWPQSSISFGIGFSDPPLYGQVLPSIPVKTGN
jgi:uncharacterized protein (TIGR03437 family)